MAKQSMQFVDVHYAATISLFAEMVLDESIRAKREADLHTLIEEALINRDKEAFMKYSAELKEVAKDEETCTT